MKCPLFMIPISESGVLDREKADECIQGECAWWDVDQVRCAILVLARVAVSIDNRLIYINRNIPHEPQNKR